jgi:hypothetical protein
MQTIKVEIGDIVVHGINVTNLSGLEKIIETELRVLISRSIIHGSNTDNKTNKSNNNNIELKTLKGDGSLHSAAHSEGRNNVHLLGNGIAKSIYANLGKGGVS